MTVLIRPDWRVLLFVQVDGLSTGVDEPQHSLPCSPLHVLLSDSRRETDLEDPGPLSLPDLSLLTTNIPSPLIPWMS